MIEADGGSRPYGKTGWGALRLILAAFSLFLVAIAAACAPPEPARPGATFPPATSPSRTPRPSPTAVVVTSNLGELTIVSDPAGADVFLDGRSLSIGSTPLTLNLRAGKHTIRLEMAGYEPATREIDIGSMLELVIEEVLEPLPGVEPRGVASPDLIVESMDVQIETGNACNYTSTDLGIRVVIENAGTAGAGSFFIAINKDVYPVAGLAAGDRAELWYAGYVPDGENVAVVDVEQDVSESNEDNNRLTRRLPVPTLPPTCTPAPPAATAVSAATATRAPEPTATATRAPVPAATWTPRPAAVVVRDGSVTIPTYPYAGYLAEGWNDTYHLAYTTLDRDAYQASSPAPSDVTYRTLVLENDVLRLTFVPELGGRIYEVFFKPTSHRVTYRNPVLKPSPWGPPEQGWWLAAGGIEWCLPVEEHGYEWGVPWAAEVSRDATGATVTLRDSTAGDRVRAAIAVRLEAGAGSFTIRPRLENPTGSALDVKYWTNAMLAPGGRNAPSSRLRFVLPDAVQAVTVHSRGDDWLPGYNERLSWPVYQGTDFSRLGNWNRWLGFFEDPAAGDFMAVYDKEYDEGLVRVFPAAVARGAKVFAFGWGDPIAPANWTDDGSVYVEIHGGPAPTFDDAVTLPAGGELEWTETWYPVAALGGLRYANAAAALQLAATPGQVEVGVAVTRAWAGDAVLSANGAELWREQVSLLPGESFRRLISPAGSFSGPVSLRLVGADGSVPAEYNTTLVW